MRGGKIAEFCTQFENEPAKIEVGGELGLELWLGTNWLSDRSHAIAASSRNDIGHVIIPAEHDLPGPDVYG